jgi:hypothetical protein
MMTMVLGVGDLSTPKGFAEYVLRLKAYEAWFGPMWEVAVEDPSPNGLAAQADKVRGLRTNVTLETRAKWFKRMGDHFTRQALNAG